MAATVQLKVGIEQALERISVLEKAIARALDAGRDSNGLKTALDKARESLKLLEEEQKRFDAWRKQQDAEADSRQREKEARQTAFIEKARAAQAKLISEQREMQEENKAASPHIFLQAIGGEEMPERIGKITVALRAAGDSSQSFTTRLMGLVGGVGLAKDAVITLALKVTDLVHDFAEATRASGQLEGGFENIRRATNGAVDAITALGDQQAFLRNNLRIQSQDLATVEQAAMGIVRVYGGSAQEAISEFSAAVAHNDRDVLSRWGVTLNEGVHGADALSAAIAQLRGNLQGVNVPQAAGTGLRGILRGAYQDIVTSGNAAINGVLGGGGGTDPSAEMQYQQSLLQRAEAVRQAQTQERILHDVQRERAEALRDIIPAQDNATHSLKAYIDQQREIQDLPQALARQHPELALDSEAYIEAYARREQATNDLAVAERLLEQQVRQTTEANEAATKTGFEEAVRRASTSLERGTFDLKDYTRQLQEQITAGEQAQAQLSAGSIEYSEYERRLQSAESASQRLQHATEAMAEAFSSARKAQSQLSWEIQNGEKVADRTLRVTTELLARARLEIPRQREQQQAARDAARQIARDQNISLQRASEFVGGQGYDTGLSFGGGPGRPIEEMRAMQQAANALIEAHGVLPRVIQRAGESSANFYRRMTAEIQAATTLQEALNRKFNESANLYEQDRLARIERARQEDQDQDDLIRQHRSTLAQEHEANERALREHLDRQEADRVAMLETQDVGRQFSQAFSQNADVTQTAAQSLAGTFSGAFNNMTSSLRSHVRAVLEGKETIGDAFKAMMHEVLLNLATESVVQSLFNLAKGIAALAMQNYPGAAQFFAASATFAAVAGIAGVGAAVTAPAEAASAASANASQFAAPSPSASEKASNASYTFVFQGDVYDTREQVEDALGRRIGGFLQRGGNLQFAGAR